MSMDSQNSTSEVTKSMASAEPVPNSTTHDKIEIPDLALQTKGCLGAIDEMQQLEHTIKKLFVTHTISQLEKQDRQSKKKAT